ncbi:MAG: SUMF1/EgtB/PvdO family nonheme iron enzyme [Candidatus Tectimicrobiota bacterium]
MKRGSRGRADLVRALAQDNPALTAAMAALLGYQEQPRAEPAGRGGATAAPGASRQAAFTDSPALQYAPADVPFWRIETYEPLVQEATPPPRQRPRTLTDPGWRQRPAQAPVLPPLAPMRTIRTRLRRVAAIQRASADVDLEATVERLSRGELLREVPRQRRRAWGAALYVIEDRARRLVPYWRDQDDVVAMLQQLYPPHGVSLARLGDGEQQPVLRWPEAQRGTSVLPAPHTLVVVLGDLGCLATQSEPLQRFWLHWGRLLHDNHNPAVALVPMPVQDVPAELARLWTVVRWDAGGPAGTAGAPGSRAATVQHLLTLLAPAIRLEPGLLRAVRCLLPEGRGDAGLEARVWQDAALRSQHSLAASLDPERRQAALARFAAQPVPVQSLVLAQIRAWRAQVHEAVWFEEVLSLAPQAQQTAVAAADLEDARQFFLAFAAALRPGESVSSATMAWVYRLTQRVPDTVEHDAEVRQAMQECYELVRPFMDETQIPPWSFPSRGASEGQTARRLALWQVADQVVLQGLESSSASEPFGVRHGSLLGVLRTLSGEVRMVPGPAAEADRSFWQDGLPPAWAKAWGYDEYGAWVTFRLQEIEQRLRWIEPGHFLMGSPENEEGRYANEGPQHNVYIARGFWLFETLCTQALWQAVMGTNPSHFQGARRPVENVSWEDCQTFLERLNARLPGLDTRLPTEAEWEYACRAGTETARYHKDVEAIAWHYDNSNNETHAVQEKCPNAWGLYDMLGNVEEWCQDGRRTYEAITMVDPYGSVDIGSFRSMRGGSWLYPALVARAALRFVVSPGRRDAHFGFRAASSSVNQPGGASATWSASQQQAEPAKTATRSPAAQRCDVQQQCTGSMVLPESAGFLLRTDCEQLRFGRYTRPAWASEMGRDEYGLWGMLEFKGVRQRLRWIPPGRFLMGSPLDEEGRLDREGPQHEVCLTRGFWLFDTPCTQALWQAVMDRNPSQFPGAERPVEQVSWEDCQQFVAAFTQQCPALPLTLPTEAQWEYACRAGTETARYQADLEAIAWYASNSNRATHEVGAKLPNAWGLYDMLGNVLEWCQDGLRDYEEGMVLDPVGPIEAGADRALRGGSWDYSAQYVRAAYRYWLHPGYRNAGTGFRAASSG